METQLENRKDKVSIEEVLEFLEEVKTLTEEEKRSSKKGGLILGQQVPVERVLEVLLEIKAQAEEEKKAKALKAQKQQDAKDSSYQVTYSFKA